MKRFYALLMMFALLLPASFVLSMMTAPAAFACGGPCPEPEPEPEVPVVPEVPAVVHDGGSDSEIGSGPCVPNPAERKKYPPSLEDDLVKAYADAYADKEWAHVWVQGGQIVDLVRVGEAGPDGATVWQLTAEPFIEDNRACAKPYNKGSMKVQGLNWD